MDKFEVVVTSDLYVAGTTEDGHPYTAETFIVEVEFANGLRFAHCARFDGCRVEIDTEDGYKGFFDIREEAQAAAEKLATRVREAGKINPKYWEERPPVYGSAMYEQAIAMMTPRQRAGEEELA